MTMRFDKHPKAPSNQDRRIPQVRFLKRRALAMSALLCFALGTMLFSLQHAVAAEDAEAKIAALQGHGGAYVDVDPRQYIKDPKVLDKLAQWQDLKFGFMVHWGPYSQWGVVESWALCPDKDWGRAGSAPWKASGENFDEFRKLYWGLNKTFNPVKFSAEKWARMAKSTGMKYFVFTTMHHDGFCMFDSKATDYKITAQDCPYHVNPKPDVTKELFNAFRQEGLWIGAYYSKPSWHNNDFWIKGVPVTDRHANYDVDKDPARWERFVQFTHTQIDQLLSDYGPVDILWLDGGWVNPKTRNQDVRMAEIAANGRAKQPGLMVVDRTIHGEFENYVTPEQKIPEKALAYPWETCMTMGKSWAYKPNEEFKSVNVCIHMLVDVVAKGGNFLLNLGASPEGEFHPTAVKQMTEIGAWMDVNGKAIHATQALAPYRWEKFAFTRSKDGTINAIYLADEGEAMPTAFTIGGIDVSGIASVELLGYGQVNHRLEGGRLAVTIPKAMQDKPPCQHAWTLALKKRPRQADGLSSAK